MTGRGLSCPSTMTRKTTKKPKGGPRTQGRLQRALDAAARGEIEKALKESDGNVTAAAATLGISRGGLWKRMRALGVRPR